jgi:hypothetical protein
MDFCKIPFTSARSGLARFTQTVAYYLPLPFIPAISLTKPKPELVRYR